MGASKQLLIENMWANEVAEQLWAESVSDHGKAYQCIRCELWVQDFDIDPVMKLCMICCEYLTRN